MIESGNSYLHSSNDFGCQNIPSISIYSSVDVLCEDFI